MQYSPKILQVLTQNRLLWVVLLILLPGVWEVGWLWQTPAAGCLAQSLRLHRHAASQGHAPICSSLEPAKQVRRIPCMKLKGQYIPCANYKVSLLHCWVTSLYLPCTNLSQCFNNPVWYIQSEDMVTSMCFAWHAVPGAQMETPLCHRWPDGLQN